MMRDSKKSGAKHNEIQQDVGNRDRRCQADGFTKSDNEYNGEECEQSQSQ